MTNGLTAQHAFLPNSHQTRLQTASLTRLSLVGRWARIVPSTAGGRSVMVRASMMPQNKTSLQVGVASKGRPPRLKTRLSCKLSNQILVLVLTLLKEETKPRHRQLVVVWC